jgi:hypothetical protein
VKERVVEVKGCDRGVFEAAGAGAGAERQENSEDLDCTCRKCELRGRGCLGMSLAKAEGRGCILCDRSMVDGDVAV